jgi:hypothetical protein
MIAGRSHLLQTSLLFVISALFTASGAGQAWMPEKGEGTVSTSFNYVNFEGHFRSDGSRTPEAASKSRSFLFDVEYGLTDRLAVTISLPVVSARYASNNPTSDTLLILFGQTVQAVDEGFYKHQFLDDLHYHTTPQDFRFNVRYHLVSHPVVITPFIGSVLPSHDYAYVGEAAPGRNLKELQFGTDVGRRLNPFLRRAYLDGQIAFAIPEQALNIRTTRTNLALEMGYLLNRKLAFRGFGHWQHTLNGLHFPEDLTTPEIILTHERLLKANYWHLGAGVSYAITPKTDVSADVVTFLSGSDTHYGTGVSMRIARSFTLRRSAKTPSN